MMAESAGGTEFSARSDGALVVAIARQEAGALEALYRRHGGAVHALARRVTGGRELAEEITQTVFVRLWQRPERFDPARASLRTFLLADAHGRSIDAMRSEAARRRRETETSSGNGRDLVIDVEMHAAGNVAAAAVRAALERLPESERLPIVLAYYGGRTYREVADELGAPEGTIKSRIRKGLRRLRDTVDTLEVAGG